MNPVARRLTVPPHPRPAAGHRVARRWITSVWVPNAP